VLLLELARAVVADYDPVMSSVIEIESAISGLPKEDFWKLAEWFDQVKAKTWDEQMQADAAAGRLDFLFEEAAAARVAGHSQPWPVQA
jgi:hypothetical protein